MDRHRALEAVRASAEERPTGRWFKSSPRHQKQSMSGPSRKEAFRVGQSGKAVRTRLQKALTS
jgi:hypothetical protein